MEYKSLIRQDGGTIERYTLSDGTNLRVDFDEFGVCKVSREVMEWLLAHADADLRREKE